MNIQSEKPRMIYKYTTDKGIELYSIGLAKKKQDGTYENGFISCRFKKDVKIENKTKILIKSAWLDFNVKDKKTYPYIFINEFEIAEQVEVPENIKTDYQEQSDVQLTDADLPF